MVAAENSAGQARHARVCRSTHQIPLRLDVHSEVPTSAVCRCKPTAAAEISHRSRAPPGASTGACIATCVDPFAARLERLYTYAAKSAEAEAKPRARVKQSVRMRARRCARLKNVGHRSGAYWHQEHQPSRRASLPSTAARPSTACVPNHEQLRRVPKADGTDRCGSRDEAVAAETRPWQPRLGRGSRD